MSTAEIILIIIAVIAIIVNAAIGLMLFWFNSRFAKFWQWDMHMTERSDPNINTAPLPPEDL